jgi:hypothetical protein
MSSARQFRQSGAPFLYRGAVVCIAMFAVLLLRNGTPVVLHAPQLHPTVNCAAHHDLRPCLDHDVFQWSTPSSWFSPNPPLLASRHLALGTDPFLGFRTQGAQHNRPPPLI